MLLALMSTTASVETPTAESVAPIHEYITTTSFVPMVDVAEFGVSIEQGRVKYEENRKKRIRQVKPRQVVQTKAPTIRSQPSAGLRWRLASYGTYAHTYYSGQCTDYAASRTGIPSTWGNAKYWGYNAPASGYAVTQTPLPGMIAWTTAGWAGHVAIVEQVEGGRILISEMNFNGRSGVIHWRWTEVSDWTGFIY